jgi:hypothetical protein
VFCFQALFDQFGGIYAQTKQTDCLGDTIVKENFVNITQNATGDTLYNN